VASGDLAELMIGQGMPHVAEHDGLGYHLSYKLDDREKNLGMEGA
jgi:hypothetical protein